VAVHLDSLSYLGPRLWPVALLAVALQIIKTYNGGIV
jgi:hypothetical protein